MSFSEYKDRISEGDIVIIYLGTNSMQTVIVSSNKVHQTKYGALPHADMIGKRFGSKMHTMNNKGWVYLLHPTPELWTLNLPHRTQILYHTDISMVLMQLDIKPGSVVVESGTGSASMSHALIRTVAPTGHVHTFEFHEDRCEKARKEFQEHKIDHLVTIKQRDVLKGGFQLDNVADAVFLDLPCPWDAIPTSKQAIKESGGRLCSFSPCIEQVQRTCEMLTNEGFKDIQVMECLLRSYDVKPINSQVPDLGPTTSEASKRGSKSPNKKRKLEDIEETVGKVAKSDSSSNIGTTDEEKKTHQNRNPRGEKKTLLTAKPVKDIPGHTGFLTFATLFQK